MRRYPTGVTILTVRDGNQIHGMTANSFTSVSLNPTLVLVCIDKRNRTHTFVARAGHFALNILGERQVHLARRFAKQIAQPADPFADITHHRVVTGAPIFDDSVAHLDCRVVAAHDAGDHTIFIGEVMAAGFGNAHDANPLVWLDGEYISMNPSETPPLLLLMN